MAKFSHVVALDTPKGMAAEFFAKKANELTKVRFEVYGNSTLYKDKEDRGAATRRRPDACSLSGQVRIDRRQGMHSSICRTSETTITGLHKVTQGPIRHSLLDKLQPKGIVGHAFWVTSKEGMSGKPLPLWETISACLLHVGGSVCARVEA